MFRGFKLICKHYFMYKVKNKMNQPISWVISTHYVGPNLLGKIKGIVHPKMHM